MAAESALQTVDCLNGARLEFENISSGVRELRLQSPVTNVFSLAPTAKFEAQCKEVWTYKLWCSTGCTSGTVLTQVPLTVTPVFNLLTNLEGCPIGPCDLGEGGDPLFQQEMLLGLAGLFGGLMVAWV